MGLKYSLKHPLHCMKYLYGSSPMVWDITRDKDWLGIPYHMDSKKDTLHDTFEYYYKRCNDTPPKSYENISGYGN